MLNKNKILLSSGGTGGHVIPAINLGNFLLKQGFECSIIIDKRGEKYIKNFNGHYFLINSYHLSVDNIFVKLKSLINLFLGLFQSLSIIIRFRPNYFISFGGYSTSMPLLNVLLYRFFIKVNVFIHEQNSIMGKVNLFFLPYVDYIFTNFKEIKNLKVKFFYKKIYSGIPSIKKNKIILINPKKQNDRKTIFVYGGSQGSSSIIKKILLVFNSFDKDFLKQIKFIVQSPKEMIENLKNSLKNLGLDFMIKDFYENIDEILIQSDIAITRSGAGTINDLITYQIPSILFPLPNSIYNHQYLNAKFLVDKNAAIIMDEENFDVNINSIIIKDLIINNIKQKIMKNSLKDIKIPNANEIILNKLLNEN